MIVYGKCTLFELKIKKRWSARNGAAVSIDALYMPGQ